MDNVTTSNNNLWKYLWLKDSSYELVFIIDLIFIMILMCPGKDNLKLLFDPYGDLD